MKNPYFVSRFGRLGHPDSNTREILKQVRGEKIWNTGNRLFISALQRVITWDGASCSFGFNPKQVQKHNDGLVIPAANWLKSGSDFEQLARRIEATDLPCVLVGLGAQAKSTGEYPVLTSGTKRLLAVVAERCHSISVRGRFSAEVLERNGIKNVAVTGCPSLLWHVDRCARVDKVAKRVTKLSLNGTRGAFNEKCFAPGGRTALGIARLAKRYCADYVAQTELPDMLLGIGAPMPGDLYQRTLRHLQRVYGDEDEVALRSYLGIHLRVFLDVDRWIEYLKERDLTVGTRLHGIIASLLAGTPGVLVTHDTRTTEMAQLAGIPVIEEARISGSADFNFQALYDAIDYDEFNRSQIQYYRSFIRYFDDNQVDHQLCRSL